MDLGRWVASGLTGFLLCAGWAAAAAPPAVSPLDGAFFTREVQPLLQQRCLGCHGVGGRLAKLDLRTREAALRGGSHGPALVPGNAEKSLLYALVSGARAPQMPPSGKLSPAEISTFKRWIEGGAPWSGGSVDTAAKQVWWSFRPVQPPVVPVLKHAEWVRTPIDAFVLQKLREHGLSPSPPAPRRVLIRRAYLDLIGLPPTPEEVQAFEADRSPDAWEKVVDRLLASPHYGERWGRHWLDLVRYADSGGFEGDKDRPLAWRYRDYVIRAFNSDKPYDLFLKEQLAGDELRPGDPEAIVATGYLAAGPQDQVQKDARTRADELDDLVSTTGSAFLGLTLGCARCHDHKYDPVPQVDYYRVQALFAPTERRDMDIPTPEERRAVEAHNTEVEKELAPLRSALAVLRDRGEKAAAAAGQMKPNEAQIVAALPEPDRKEWTRLQAAVKAAEAKRRELPKAYAVTDKGPKFGEVHLNLRGDAFHPGPVVQPGFLTVLPGGDQTVGPEAATAVTTGRRRALAEWIARPENPLTARVWMNRVWKQHFGRGIVASVSNFGINGELPSHPELLDWLAYWFTQPAASSGNDGERERLRDRGTDGARARSISPSLSPSIVMGQAAPSPRQEGFAWRLKPVHRLILLSATYQQSSNPSQSASSAVTSNPQSAIRNPQSIDPQSEDPQNRWLWRMPVRRLEAEAIRDSILAVAGTLNREMGGPPVYPPVDPSLRADTFLGINWPVGEDSPKTWRRSVYVKVKRSLIFPGLDVFDCPEITAHVAQRNVTTTPLQALLLLNDPLILRQAGLFAERVAREAGPDSGSRVDRAYWLALGRAPSPRERALSLEFLQSRGPSGLTDFCHSLLNLNEFVYSP